MVKIGLFKCTSCGLMFHDESEKDKGWYILCPNKCTTNIKYDNHLNYKSPNRYFVWLNKNKFIK